MVVLWWNLEVFTWRCVANIELILWAGIFRASDVNSSLTNTILTGCCPSITYPRHVFIQNVIMN